MRLTHFVLALLTVLNLADEGRAAERTSNLQEAGSVQTGIGKGKDLPRYSRSGFDLTPLSRERVAEICRSLTPEQVAVTQRAGTEPPFCGNLLDNKEDGLYACVVCGLPLFRSEDKFDSGTGWPSFLAACDQDHVGEREDRSGGLVRTEIFCRRCDAHLGHVFPDGPPPTGRRFCLNSAALNFLAAGADLPAGSRPVATETAYFAGGCFWGVEHAFSRHSGVVDAVSGYQNGHTESPTYNDVCSGTTGHAETVKVVFDPRAVGYRELVEFFFEIHDPTTPNRQGPDVGTQYRSGLFTAGEEQERIAREVVSELTGAGAFGGRPIVTVVEPAQTFYPAEAYHQDYHARHGGSCKF